MILWTKSIISLTDVKKHEYEDKKEHLLYVCYSSLSSNSLYIFSFNTILSTFFDMERVKNMHVEDE